MFSYATNKSVTPMMFNDCFDNAKDINKVLLNGLKDTGVIICYWEYSNHVTPNELYQNGYKKIINTHNKWYYVIGAEDTKWNGYSWSKANMSGTYKDCKLVDNADEKEFKTDTGCMFAVWCDDPSVEYSETIKSNVNTLISTLATNNQDYFKASATTDGDNSNSGNGNLGESNGSTDNGSTDNGTVTTTVDVELEVGKTETIKISGNNYSNDVSKEQLVTSIATVDVTGVDEVVGSTTYTYTKASDVKCGELISSDSSEYKSTNYYYQVDDKYYPLFVLRSSETSFIFTTYYYYYYNGIEYVQIGDKHSVSSWNNSNENIPFTVYTRKETTVDPVAASTTITITGVGEGTTTVTVGDTKYNITVTAPTTTETKNIYKGSTLSLPNGAADVTVSNSAVSYSDGVITANAVGTAIVTFVTKNDGGKVTGKYTYNITVTAEDLNVDSLPIQLWITNNIIKSTGSSAVNASYNDYGFYEKISPSEAYGENGALLSELISNNITGYKEYDNIYFPVEDQTTSITSDWSERLGQTLTVFKGKLLTSDKYQTKVGSDQSLVSSTESNGCYDFNYVRYYNGKWAVSEDRVTWYEVGSYGRTTNSSESGVQIVAYYMILSQITNEVTTDVADWGYPEGGKQYSKQLGGDYVLLDFAVKYEDGTRTPTSFPVDQKTMAFHCDSGNAIGSVSSGSGLNSTTYKYRKLYNFRAINSSDYEVYMVTVTMTDDNKSTTISDTSSYTYDGTEQIIWAIDETTKTNSELAEYASYSGENTGCTIGGDPYIRGIEVYNKHGALITYYVRAKETENDLFVHYRIQGGTTDFHYYSIKVKGNTVFNEGFARTESGELINNTVLNNLGVTQTVSSDLKTMLSIPAQYRYTDFEFVSAERSEDGKNVYLYYTFNSDVTFVVDFGLPFVITPTSVNESLSSAKITKAEIVYTGDLLTIDNSDPKSIKVTPNKVIDRTVRFTLKYSGTSLDETNSGEVLYNIEILPASNVYYEESFLTADTKWKTTGTATNTPQKTEELGSKTNNYGYDSAYAGDSTYSGGSALKAEVYVDMPVAYRPTASFTFTGTGFDIVSECSNKTAWIFAKVTDTKTNEVVKRILCDTYFVGDEKYMTNGTTTYQIPVIRCTDLPYSSYKVEIMCQIYVERASQTAVATYGSDSNTFDLYAVIDDLGIPYDELDTLELAFIDENSLLNGGTGASSSNDNITWFSVNTFASETEPTKYEVYLDGYRIYNTLELNDDGYTSDQYANDSENGLKYVAAYDYLVSDVNYHVYVETKGNEAATEDNIKNYKEHGPQNEVYLVNGASIAFAVDNVDKIQVSAKSVDGKTVVLNGTEIKTGTEMYYTISKTDGYFVIANTGDGVLSIPEIKIPKGVAARSIDEAEQPAVLSAINTLMMSTPIDPEEPDTPIIPITPSEPDEPETFEPEYLEAYALPVAFRKLGSTVTVTSSVEDGMVVYIESENRDAVQLTPANKRLVEWGITDKYIYTFKTGALETGRHTYSVYAVKDGIRSESVEVTFIVW